MATEYLNDNSDLAHANIEEHQTETQTGHNGHSEAATGHADAHGHADAQDGHGGGGIQQPSDVFPELLSGLGDHGQFTVFNYKILDLPKIIYDDGLFFYADGEAMEEAGVFTTEHHHIVRKDTGEAPTLDLSMTNLVCFQLLAAIIVLFIFGAAGRRAKKNKGKAPSGVQNLIEAMVVFVRDDIVSPNIPAPRAVRGLLPYFVGLFFFILGMNLFGLVPGGHTATGSLAVTGALAVISYFVINITAIREAGIGAWFKHLLGGAPVWLCFIMVPIEIISMFVKPFALTIRLFANMTAGHVVLLSLVGLIFFFNIANGPGVAWGVAPISVAFSVFMYMLELLVAFLQAYVFTLLTAVFVGLAIGDHAHEYGHEH